ncbi:MAG: hypothetical protein JWN70_1946 [Planctomycetaceae bacterium]|nr:hypothetical protein [Planctomycetaceae bacterium]
MNVADELEKLQRLYQSGALNEFEYATAKEKILSAPPVATPVTTSVFGTAVTNVEEQTKLWAFALHLSILAGYAVPIAGFVLPIVIWQLKKDELPGLDAHGKNAVNWLISKMIYVVICVLLMFVVIGFPLLALLGLLGIIFPIVAAIKAKNGETWKYPMAISFFMH